MVLLNLFSHTFRLLRWRLNQVKPTEHEAKKMDEAGVPDIAALRGLLAWRRTNMMFAVPITMARFVPDGFAKRRTVS